MAFTRPRRMHLGRHPWRRKTYRFAVHATHTSFFWDFGVRQPTIIEIGGRLLHGLDALREAAMLKKRGTIERICRRLKWTRSMSEATRSISKRFKTVSIIEAIHQVAAERRGALI